MPLPRKKQNGKLYEESDRINEKVKAKAKATFEGRMEGQRVTRDLFNMLHEVNMSRLTPQMKKFVEQSHKIDSLLKKKR